MGTIQSSTAQRYELRDSWGKTDRSYCWSASGFKGCAWRPSFRLNHMCSYVDDTQSFLFYPSAAPQSQTVYVRGYSDWDSPPTDVYACPAEDERYVEITVNGTQPTCLCEYSKVHYMQNGETLCYTGYGKTVVSCDDDIFQDSAWNVIRMDAQAPALSIDGDQSITALITAAAIVAAVMGVVFHRVWKAKKEAERVQQDDDLLKALLYDA